MWQLQITTDRAGIFVFHARLIPMPFCSLGKNIPLKANVRSIPLLGSADVARFILHFDRNPQNGRLLQGVSLRPPLRRFCSICDDNTSVLFSDILLATSRVIFCCLLLELFEEGFRYMAVRKFVKSPPAPRVHEMQHAKEPEIIPHHLQHNVIQIPDSIYVSVENLAYL
jgi:hypothetical protein